MITAERVNRDLDKLDDLTDEAKADSSRARCQPEW